MSSRGQLSFVNEILWQHQCDLMASFILVLIVTAHLLAGIEARFLFPEAAIAGIVSSLHCYFRATHEQVYAQKFGYSLDSAFVDTPTQVMVTWALLWVMVYLLVLVIARDLSGPDWVYFVMTAVLGPVALAVPGLIAEGAFREPRSEPVQAATEGEEEG